MRIPAVHRSWRICPECGSRGPKTRCLNTGLYHCQNCRHDYPAPDVAPDKVPTPLVLTIERKLPNV